MGLNSDNVKVKLVPERIGTTAVILDSNLVWYGNLSPSHISRMTKLVC